RAVPVLVDERAIPEPTIRQSAQAVAGVKSAYGIRSRGGAGAGVRYAEVTIAVDPAANVADAHAIADAVEERLKKDLELQEVAVRELQTSAQDQYLLTEVLLLEHVDRIIARRLRLPSFPRWRQKHRALREAQREPTHWGFDRAHPIVPWAARLEPGDVVVAVGAPALAEALFLAAHDAEVFLLDQDLGAVEAAEGRAVSEQLAGAFQALVINFGSWFPDLAPALVAIAPGSLAPLRAKDRAT